MGCGSNVPTLIYMMISVNIVYSKEAIREIDEYINSKSYIIGARGEFASSAATAIPNRVFKAFTGVVTE